MADSRTTQSISAASPTSRPASIVIPPWSFNAGLFISQEGDCPGWYFDVDTTLHTLHARLSVAGTEDPTRVGSGDSIIKVYDNHSIIDDTNTAINLVTPPYQDDPTIKIVKDKLEVWVSGVWLFAAGHVMTLAIAQAGKGARGLTVRVVD